MTEYPGVGRHKSQQARLRFCKAEVPLNVHDEEYEEQRAGSLQESFSYTPAPPTAIKLIDLGRDPLTM